MAPSGKQKSSETSWFVIDLHTIKGKSIKQFGMLLNLSHSPVFDIIKRYKKQDRIESIKGPERPFKLTYGMQRCQPLRNILTSILNWKCLSCQNSAIEQDKHFHFKILVNVFPKNLRFKKINIFILKYWLLYSVVVGISDLSYIRNGKDRYKNLLIPLKSGPCMKNSYTKLI